MMKIRTHTHTRRCEENLHGWLVHRIEVEKEEEVDK